MPASASPTCDDTGRDVAVPAAVRRVVSLVPSLTEAIAVTAPGLLVGATDWCAEPADLDVPRIGGTKNPRVPDVLDLAPDLVLANAEENRAGDLDALRTAGLPVWVTAPEALPVGGARRTALVPIWRRPWMALGRDTFAGDLLARLGVDNVLAASPERYPKVTLGELPAVDLVVLPDEPYAFSAVDGPEAFLGVPAALVSGRHLTWYGPSLAEARDVLAGQLDV
jgi:ABC-type Fe3+-hydroxamate transport system substrate-binding protein